MRAAVRDWKAPEYGPIFEERVERLRNLRRLDDDQLAKVWRYYQDNPVDWIEDWAMTYDPRPESGQDFVPFILFPRQRELVGWLRERFRTKTPGVVEKSRDVGASWLMAAFSVWAWTFHEAKVGIGSYRADKVDILGNMDTILEKARAIIRFVPEELRPQGLDFEKDLLFQRIKRPDSMATITGEVGDNIGRGGRCSMYFVDEFAHLQHPELADASLSATAECKVWASSPFGLGNFHQKCTSGTFPVFRFHWRDDPRKDDAWADSKRKEVGPVIWAQEFELDHGASVENVVVDQRWIEAAARGLKAKLREKGVDLPRRQDHRGTTGYDVGGGGAGKSVAIARNGPIVSPPKAWGDADTIGGARKALRYAKARGTPRLNFDAVGVGTGVASVLRHSDDLRLPPPSTPAKREETVEDLVNQAAAAQGTGNLDEVEVVGEDIVAKAVNVGESPSKDVRWPDGKRSKEKFANLRAEVWWLMRDRFEKTYERWLYECNEEAGHPHPLEECIFLPSGCDDLERELAAPTWHEQPSGKVAIESKKDMASRGVKSPDHADALSLTFVPSKKGLEVRRKVW